LSVLVLLRMFDFDESLLLEGISSSPLVNSVTPLHPKKLSEPWAKGRSICRGFQLEVTVSGAPTILYFCIDKSFPVSIPVLFLTPWDVFGIVPHVETDGFICYAQEEGILLDSENIIGLAQEAITRAVSVVECGIAGTNHQDFLDEFGVYWGRTTNIRTAMSLVSPSIAIKEVSLYKQVTSPHGKGKSNSRKNRSPKKVVHWYLYDDLASLNQYFHFTPDHAPKSSKVLFIPLQPGRVIVPPHPATFWDLAEVRRIVFNNLSDHQKLELAPFLSSSTPEEMIILSIPRISGGETLIGIRFSGIKKYRPHPLHQEGEAAEISPFSLTRRDREYLLPRGGSNLALAQKRVLLLGCGALGGYIAAELTRAGVLQLTVLDEDTLAADNYFRHLLGRKHLGKPKVIALKEDIEGRLPYVEVTALHCSLEEALERHQIQPGEFDLIISALGNPTVELAFNNWHQALQSAAPALFTWLEPYGIGGHAVLTKFRSACLKCLYPKPADEDIFCRASFAGKNQKFAKNISGCRNVFTPFGSLDAMKTAELATRLAIGTLTGSVSAPIMLSWKGDATEFLNNGFTLSPRYGSDMLEIENFHYPECPICHE